MKKKNIKYIVIGLATSLLLSGLLIYQKVFNAQHREIFEEHTEFTISADELQFHFADNQKTATKKTKSRIIAKRLYFCFNSTAISANFLIRSF